MSSAKRPLQIGVVGSSKPTDRERSLAYAVGGLLAEAGVTVVCGGLGGVMEECCRGAQDRGGLTFGILPGTTPAEGNPYLTVVLPSGIGELRNGLVVRASAALIAIGSGYGTLSEIALARRTGLSCVLLESFEGILAEPPLASPQGGSLYRAVDPEEAVRLALEAGAAV